MMRIGIEAQHIFRNKKQTNDLVAIELIRCLQETDQVNEYFIFVRPGIDRCLEETKNFRIVDIPAAPSYIWEQVYLPEAAVLEKCDLLHCTGITAPIFSKVPIIATFHDITLLEHLLFFQKETTLTKKIDNVYLRYVSPKVIQNSKAVITFSESQRSRVIEYFKIDAQKINVVYKGITTLFHKITDEDCLIKTKKKYSLPDNYILITGLSGSLKEIKIILSAFVDKISDSGKPLILAIVSDKRIQAKLNAYNLPDTLKNTVCILRPVLYSDLPALYSMSEFVINVSVKEEAAYKIMEALACNVPVISSQSETITEIAGKASATIDVTNPEALAEVTNLLLTDDQYKENILKEAQSQLSHFTWNQMAGKIIKIYQQVLANKQ